MGCPDLAETLIVPFECLRTKVSKTQGAEAMRKACVSNSPRGATEVLYPALLESFYIKWNIYLN